MCPGSEGWGLTLCVQVHCAGWMNHSAKGGRSVDDLHEGEDVGGCGREPG